MAIIRGHHDFDEQFTQIPNEWLRDSRLSLEARGLIGQIMSHRPGWRLSIKGIASQNGIGRDRVRRILDELMTFGYLERSEKQLHDEKGRLSGFTYTTRDPQGMAWKPCKGEPSKAEPSKAFTPPKNTIKKNNNLKEEQEKISAFAQFWEAYPKKADKRTAMRAYEKALQRADAQVIHEAALRYRNDPNREDRYTKNPATWLNADAWENGPEPSREAPRKISNAERAALLALELEAKEKARAIEQAPEVYRIESTSFDWIGRDEA